MRCTVNIIKDTVIRKPFTTQTIELAKNDFLVIDIVQETYLHEKEYSVFNMGEGNTTVQSKDGKMYECRGNWLFKKEDIRIPYREKRVAS